MKNKILFIGEFNEIMKDLVKAMEEYFDVQLCVPAPSVIAKYISAYQADLILLNLSGLKMPEFVDTTKVIGTYMLKKAPITVIGTPDETTRAVEMIHKAGLGARYIDAYSVQIHKIERPVSNEIILQMLSHICEMEEKHITKTDKKQVLVIDDDPMIIRQMAKTLAGTYKVLGSTSGVDGLAKMEQVKPDVVFLDYDMPGLDGSKILEAIKSDDLISHIPVYILSGRCDSETVNKLIQLRPDGYFLKSGNISDIKHTLDERFKKKEEEESEAADEIEEVEEIDEEDE